MSNTQYRILSAIFLMIVVALAVYTGKTATLLFCLIAGILSIDELLINFNKFNRKSFSYITIQFLFFLAFVVFNMFYSMILTQTLFTIFSVFFNLFLIFYLFKMPLSELFMKNSTERYPGIISSLIILPLLSFGMHFTDDSWRKVLLLLLVVTFSMDTGAWFFGKNFGKHKLWPAVSPNKTIEGLVGGIFTSSLLGSLTWYLAFSTIQWESTVIFGLCGLISQVGDLIQSKIKREFGIKDSSNLIPGHGGVYDRIDSLIFLSPFFILVVKYLRHQFAL